MRRGRARGGEAGQRLQAAGCAGDLLPGPEGCPRVPASRAEGDGCHGNPGRRGGGVRVRWKGAGGQVSPPHLRAGAAKITRWPSHRGYREPLKMVT